MNLLRLAFDLRFFRVGNFPPILNDTIQDVNVTVGRQMQKAALVKCVAADEQVTDSVENQSERAKDDASLVSVMMELVAMLHVVFVVYVKHRLNDFDDDREAKRRQKNTNNHHREDINSSPTECILQRFFMLMLFLLLLAHVLRDNFFLLLIFAELSGRLLAR